MPLCLGRSVDDEDKVNSSTAPAENGKNGAAVFATTHWSLVLEAQSESPAALEALEKICRAYWRPIYSFLRRQGHSPEEAEDLTQGFFALILERRDLDSVRQEKGRLRSYLLASLKHFTSDRRRHEMAIKRGRRQGLIPLVELRANERVDLAFTRPVETLTADQLYERRWALALMEQVLGRLKDEYRATGNGVLFDWLKQFSLSANDNTIYLGSSSKVFKSTDLGATWIDMSAGLGKGGIQALLFDGTTLFAGTPADSAGMYRSTNGGASWEPVAAGLPIGKTIRSLISFGAYVFAGTEGDGIYRSSDHGDTWAKTDINNMLLAQTLVLTFCAKDNELFAGATNGIYKSTDGGATFQRILNGFPTNIGVFAWSLTASGGNVVAAVTVLFSPSEALDAIFYSPDNGSTWHQATLPITPTAVTAVASDGSSLAYAGVFGQSSSVKGLYKSTDAGVTWSQRPALNVDIERLAAKGSNVLAGDLFAAYYSTDFGENWNFSSPPGNCPFGCGIFTYTFRDNSIFGGDEVGMFLSMDSGASWIPVNEGFPVCPIPDIEASCADNIYLFSGTGGEGVWRKLLGPTPTPTPTPSPTPTGTVSPTPTPTPTATATATGTPRPSPTPRGTPMPRPRPTPIPRPTPRR